MSTIVQIQVNVDDAKALSALTNIENIGKRLSSTPIEIKVNAGVVDKVSESVIQLAKEQTKQATASAKQAAAEAKVQVAQEKTKQTSNRLAAQQEKTAQSANRLATGQTKAASATQKAGTEAQKTSALTDLLGDSLGRIVAKQAAWQLIGNGIAAVKNSFKEALATMKEVDSELATVRKVTGMTAEEMNALGDSAYSTASKYGVSANEYLQNVATFARAGYKEASEGLGELAIKTQLVGDTDQETSAQFLLSADAAWKYHGNVEKLSLALDEANTIDNNYATSIQKIAEGLPIVANVAAMAGMTMEETMAMLGTITATTQESGTKAATAARALILNILGDTTTEISDGVTATEESVQSLSGILRKYAPDVVAAAEATGELVNPMEAIEALSKAAKDGLISEADLMQMVSALGGKLRTNQLLALLENFDMYKNMLADMGVAAGSANNEMGVMLDTWASKTNILKNTWTEFVSHLVDTSAIKGGLDVVTGIVKGLDTESARFAITIAGATSAMWLLGKGATAAQVGIKALALSQGPLAAGATISTAAIKALTAALLSNPLFWGAIGVAAIYGIVKAADALTTTYEEQVQIVDELSRKYDSLYGTGSEYDQLVKKGENLTEIERKRLDILKAEKAQLEDQLKIEKELEFKKWRNQNYQSETTGKYSDDGVYEGEQTVYHDILSPKVANWNDRYAALSEQYESGAMSAADYRQKLSSLRGEFSENAQAARDYAESGHQLRNSEEDLVELDDKLVAAINATTDTMGESTDAAVEQSNSFTAIADATLDATEALAEYENKLKGLTDYTENANKFADAFDAAREQYEQGMRNTPEILAFLDTTVPPDVQRELGYSVEKLWDYAVNGVIGKVSGANNPAHAIFQEIEKGVSNGALENIVQMQDGLITHISSWSELADAMGVNQGWLQAMVESLMAYNDTMFFTDEEAQSLFDTIANGMQETGGALELTTDNIGGFVDGLRQLTGAQTEVALQQAFDGMLEALDFTPSDEVIERAHSEISALFGNQEDGTPEQGQTQTIHIKVEGSEEAKQQVQQVNSELETLSEENPVKIKVSTPGAASAKTNMKGVRAATDAIPSSKSISINVLDKATGPLRSINEQLTRLKNIIVTLSFNGVINHAAEGRKNSPGEIALVNDGKPVNGSAAELIVDRHGARIENGGKMAITKLEPGSTVYTAEETAAMMNGKPERIKTYALGDVPSGSSGGYAYGGNSADEDSEGKALSDEVNKLLSNLDKQIKLAQNRNDKVLEQALQKEAATLVKTYVEKMLAAGLSSKDDAVLDLLNKGYGYSDSLMDELVDALENLTASTDAANSLAEKEQAVEKARQELENAKKQRTVRIYNPVTGQWEWVAKADDILEAQENLAKAEKDYQDAKIEKELDAIRKGSIGDIGDLTMSPALRELIASASDDEQKRIADILHAISGGAKDTTDTSGESIFKSTDSHDVYYQFGDLKLSETEARNMTVKELAEQLKTLKLT